MDQEFEFAKAALTGLLASPDRPKSQGWQQAVAEDAWKIAKEMMLVKEDGDADGSEQ